MQQVVSKLPERRVGGEGITGEVVMFVEGREGGGSLWSRMMALLREVMEGGSVAECGAGNSDSVE